jgi:hypothetical protein
LKIPKRSSESLNRRTDNITVTGKMTKRQTRVYKTLHRKQKIEITHTDIERIQYNISKKQQFEKQYKLKANKGGIQ